MVSVSQASLALLRQFGSEISFDFTAWWHETRTFTITSYTGCIMKLEHLLLLIYRVYSETRTFVITSYTGCILCTDKFFS